MADGLFGAIAGGAASGAGQGATLGSIIPGVGTGVGTAVGAGIGALAGGIMAGNKQNAANKAQQIPLIDPMERARLNQLEQTRKSISAGTDIATQNAINEQNVAGKAAQSAITKNTGGDVGTTIDALLKSQRATQTGVNQAAANSQQRMPYFDNAVGNLLQRISQRRLELGLLNRSQKLAENAQARTDNNVNAQALLATQGGTQTIPEGVSQTVPLVNQGVQSLMSLFKGNPQPLQLGQPSTGEALTPDYSVGDIQGVTSSLG